MIGVPYDKFWNATLNEVLLISEAYDNKLLSQADRQRQLEWTILQTATAGLSGELLYKKIKSPKKLYELPHDNLVEHRSKEKPKVDLERAEAAYNKSKTIPKWHHKS